LGAKRKEKREIVNQNIHLLELSCIYDLQKTKDETERCIEVFLRWDNLLKTSHLFDIPSIKVLTNLFLPLAQEENHGYKYFVSEGKSQVLWSWLEDREFEQTQLEGLSLDEINSNPLLPRLIKTHMSLTAKEEEGSDVQYMARELVRDLPINAPNELHDNMSHASDRNTAGRMCLMGILKDASTKHKEAFKRLYITLLEEYNQV